MIVVLNTEERIELEKTNAGKYKSINQILEGLEKSLADGNTYYADVPEAIFFTATIALKMVTGDNGYLYSRFKELGRLQTLYFDQSLAKKEREVLGIAPDYSPASS